MVVWRRHRQCPLCKAYHPSMPDTGSNNHLRRLLSGQILGVTGSSAGPRSFITLKRLSAHVSCAIELGSRRLKMSERPSGIGRWRLPSVRTKPPRPPQIGARARNGPRRKAGPLQTAGGHLRTAIAGSDHPSVQRSRRKVLSGRHSQSHSHSHFQRLRPDLHLHLSLTSLQHGANLSRAFLQLAHSRPICAVQIFLGRRLCHQSQESSLAMAPPSTRRSCALLSCGGTRISGRRFLTASSKGSGLK
mmetsp:Transcript_54508/g.98289  ORF Transcript_54508/g.98289 Transcript_54508/m.98289 type:complete len:246 (+) Transcript_54508:688-1425(+)